VSGFGPLATDLAARIGDAYTTTSPDPEMLKRFRDQAKKGATAQVGFKVAWGKTEEEGLDHAYRIWPNSGIPGELSQVLPTVEHFEQASTLVTKDKLAETTTAGPDVDAHVKAFGPFLEAGFDEIYVANMGPSYVEMLRAYGTDVLPALRQSRGS